MKRAYFSRKHFAHIAKTQAANGFGKQLHPASIILTDKGDFVAATLLDDPRDLAVQFPDFEPVATTKGQDFKCLANEDGLTEDGKKYAGSYEKLLAKVSNIAMVEEGEYVAGRRSKEDLDLSRAIRRLAEKSGHSANFTRMSLGNEDKVLTDSNWSWNLPTPRKIQ